MINIIKFTLGMIVVACMLYSCSAMAQVNVRGYYRSNGTYVRPHTRTAPDGIKWNNKSYRGW